MEEEEVLYKSDEENDEVMCGGVIKCTKIEREFGVIECCRCVMVVVVVIKLENAYDCIYKDNNNHNKRRSNQSLESSRRWCQLREETADSVCLSVSLPPAGILGHCAAAVASAAIFLKASNRKRSRTSAVLQVVGSTKKLARCVAEGVCL